MTKEIQKQQRREQDHIKKMIQRRQGDRRTKVSRGEREKEREIARIEYYTGNGERISRRPLENQQFRSFFFFFRDKF